MLIELKNRKQIASVLSKKIEKDRIDKTELAKRCGMARSTLYQLIGVDYPQSYSIDNLLKVCKELGVKIYVEY